MKTLNVLVIDDEPGIRSGVQRILQNFTVSYPFMDEDIGFYVMEAESGEQGIEKINSESVDLVLLDNKLPGIQGTEVLEHIKKTKPEVIVMMITSYASLELAVKATSQGAYDFIPKPFTPQELKSSMENISKHLFLKGMTSKMKKAGKEVRFQFLSVLSHELKAPLNAIEGYLRIMQDRQAGNSLDDYESMIERSLDRIKGMRNLIMDLLDLTKIRLEKKSDKMSKVSLKNIGQMAIEAINPYAIQKDIAIDLNAEDVYYNADPNDMEIIFNNLISNAVKYNNREGKVEVDIRKYKNNIKIVVKDTGIGISDEDAQKLFQEFYRIKSDKTKNISGSGLGLSIVKRVVDLYNGEIYVESELDSGSKFTVLLPLNG